MLCAVCDKREATVHLTMIAGDSGTMQKMDLCEECAQTKRVDDPTAFSLFELMHGLPPSPRPEQRPPP
jgi:protein arginine kinase activator